MRTDAQRQKWNAYMRAWNRQNPDNVRARKKKYYAANKEAIRASIQKNKYMLRHRYGVDRHEFDRLLQSQGGKCKICGKLPESKRKTLCVDHDHTTGLVRGLLCTKCNSGIAFFSEDVDSLRAAIAYLVHAKQEAAA